MSTRVHVATETGRKSPLRKFDDNPLLDIFDHAHETSDEHWHAIAAEPQWRGI